MVRKNKGRYILSLLILVFYSTVFALAVSASRFDPTPAIFTGIILMPIVAYLLGMVWRYDLVPSDARESTVEKSSEKRKRQVLDDVLRDLSDEDLLRLQRRLQDGTIDDDMLYEQIGDDGEWLRNQRNQ